MVQKELLEEIDELKTKYLNFMCVFTKKLNKPKYQNNPCLIEQEFLATRAILAVLRKPESKITHRDLEDLKEKHHPILNAFYNIKDCEEWNIYRDASQDLRLKLMALKCGDNLFVKK